MQEDHVFRNDAFIELLSGCKYQWHFNEANKLRVGCAAARGEHRQRGLGWRQTPHRAGHQKHGKAGRSQSMACPCLTACGKLFDAKVT